MKNVLSAPELLPPAEQTLRWHLDGNQRRFFTLGQDLTVHGGPRDTNTIFPGGSDVVVFQRQIQGRIYTFIKGIDDKGNGKRVDEWSSMSAFDLHEAAYYEGDPAKTEKLISKSNHDLRPKFVGPQASPENLRGNKWDYEKEKAAPGVIVLKDDLQVGQGRYYQLLEPLRFNNSSKIWNIPAGRLISVYRLADEHFAFMELAAGKRSAEIPSKNITIHAREFVQPDESTTVEDMVSQFHALSQALGGRDSDRNYVFDTIFRGRLDDPDLLAKLRKFGAPQAPSIEATL